MNRARQIAGIVSAVSSLRFPFEFHGNILESQCDVYGTPAGSFGGAPSAGRAPTGAGPPVSAARAAFSLARKNEVTPLLVLDVCVRAHAPARVRACIAHPPHARSHGAAAASEWMVPRAPVALTRNGPDGPGLAGSFGPSAQVGRSGRGGMDRQSAPARAQAAHTPNHGPTSLPVLG